MFPSLTEIESKTAEKNSAQTNKQTDTTKIMVTRPWTNRRLSYRRGTARRAVLSVESVSAAAQSYS